MQERGHNVFITNSVDKTIRVWDVDNVLEVVHPLDRLLTSIDDLKDYLYTHFVTSTGWDRESRSWSSARAPTW